ncbi:hypothetical protein HY837_04890 [archaeon]|nr:hypothetical protein [archaeon]
MLARKARRVTAYILDKSTSSSAWEEGVDFSIHNAFVIEGWGYNPQVYITNQDSKSKSYDLAFFMYDTAYSAKEALFSFFDDGLDGRVNGASLSYSEYECGESDEEGKFFSLSEQKGLEHQEFFQQKYEEALNVLLNYYEQKTQQSK